jgi:hypothetical protein
MLKIIDSKRIESYNVKGQFDNPFGKIGPKSDYNYFVYQWQNMTESHPNYGKTYIGFHKGVPWDNYHHSATDINFKTDFANNRVKWDYYVLEYFTRQEDAKKAEGFEIREFKKEYGEHMSYNKHNGNKPKVDLNKAKQMMNRINNNEFEVKIGKKEDLNNLDEYQVRYIDHPEHVNYIARMIDENMGSIEDTDPLVIATNAKDAIGSNRSRIGGRHTQKGILNSKHAVEYKFMEIDLSDWTAIEINQLGLLLNPEIKKKRIENMDEDYEKHLLHLWETSGCDAFSYEAGTMMVGFGLDTKRRTKLANKVQKQIEDIEYERKTGKTWKKWSTTSTEWDVLQQQYKYDKQTAVVGMSSSMFKFDTIVNILNGSSYEKIVVLIHHKDPEAKKKWARDIQPEKIQIMDTFIEAAGFKYEFQEAPTTKSDKVNK